LGMSKNFAYYNEWDRGAAAWLRELIKRGLIADGIVDERSITEVSPDDIRGFNQCHWFAGVGGWSYSLRIAGIPDEYPVWTASLPCQPFSAAGKQLGKADERHLLPHYLELVRQCKPNLQLGEQVEGAIRHGWLDDLQTTMEAEGYSVGHCILGAHGVGSYHQRQRLYWVADSDNRDGRTESRFTSSHAAESWNQSGRGGEFGGVADSKREQCTEQVNGCGNEERARTTNRTDAHGGEFQDIEWLYCRDNKHRPIKPGIKPLVDGIPRGMVRSGDTSQPINANETAEARVMRLKGYGNAIVPQAAAEFIRAFMEIA
jgi:DNA (cytosine-5)-methyltransferase 1